MIRKAKRVIMKKLQLLYLGAILSLFTLGDMQCIDYTDSWHDSEEATLDDSSLENNYDEENLYSDDDNNYAERNLGLDNDEAVSPEDNYDEEIHHRNHGGYDEGMHHRNHRRHDNYEGYSEDEHSRGNDDYSEDMHQRNDKDYNIESLNDEITADKDLSDLNETRFMDSGDYNLDDFGIANEEDLPTSFNTQNDEPITETYLSDDINFEQKNSSDVLLAVPDSDTTDYNPELNLGNDDTAMFEVDGDADAPTTTLDFYNEAPTFEAESSDDELSADSEKAIIAGTIATTQQPTDMDDFDSGYQGDDFLTGSDYANFDSDLDNTADDGSMDFDTSSADYATTNNSNF
jgi:hypothetical protein